MQIAQSHQRPIFLQPLETIWSLQSLIDFIISQNEKYFIHQSKNSFEKSDNHSNTDEFTFSQIQKVGYLEVWSISQKIDLSKYTQKKTFSQIFRSCSFNYFSNEVKKQIRIIQALTQIKFDDKKSLHTKILFSIQKLFFRQSSKYQRYGQIWLQIGFSDIDPIKDIQEIGIFGLIQILAFGYYHYDLLIKIFQEDIIPLGVSLIKCSHQSVQCLLMGNLDDLVLLRNNAVSIVNNLFFAKTHLFFKSIKQCPLNQNTKLQQIQKQNPIQQLEQFSIDLQSFQQQDFQFSIE